MKWTSIRIQFFAVFLLSIGAINSQENNNTITYKAPSKKFIDITIQSHKGLPRFGEQHYLRNVTPFTNIDAYQQLVDLKYMTSVFNDINKNAITENKNSSDKKERHSAIAQTKLLRLAGLLCSESVLKEYFCSGTPQPKAKTQTCVFTDNYGQRKLVPGWGGRGANEFVQRRKYTAFVNEYLNDLQQWSNTFFNSDEEMAYVVGRISVHGKYDFQKKGYWISRPISRLGGRPLSSAQLVIYTENERKLKNSEILWSIAPENARKLGLTDRSPLFIVTKARFYQENKKGDQAVFKFELAAPALEIYKDPALSQKLGEIKIDNLVTKY